MDIWNSMAGMATAELTSADLHRQMSRLNEAGLRLEQVRYDSELTARFRVPRRQVKELRRLVSGKGDTLRIAGREGIYWIFRRLAERKLLIFGLALLLVLMAWVPSRVLIVTVEGNHSVPSRRILEAAEEAGVGFGASRRAVRSEQMKNHLLSLIPELQWAGVNTCGCQAVITVREREEAPETRVSASVGSIVAARDGYVLTATATRGSLLCAPGQAVQAGEVLISGYTDCGLTISATQAEGEVMALTDRDLEVIAPANRLQRTGKGDAAIRYSLILGKKRINFYKGSGISGVTCVKMYSEYVLTLPGGFQLPVKLLRTVYTDYGTAESPVSKQEDALSHFAAEYLKHQMVAGRIRNREENVALDGAVYRLTGCYDCQEMIGRYREEKIGEDYGKTDRTDGER